MLVLGRKPGESVRIGDDVFIKVVTARNGQIKLGIDAPEEIKIVRTELEGKRDAA
jgi:carbon storage regulator